MNKFIDIEDIKKRFFDDLYIEYLQKQNLDLKNRIVKSIHLIYHNDITDYSVFEENLLKILEGEIIEKKS